MHQVIRQERLRRRRLKRKIISLVIIFTIPLVLVIFLFKFISSFQKQPLIISPIVESVNQPLKIVGDEKAEVRVVAGNELGSKIESILSDEQGTYGIIFKNLKTGEEYSLNKDKVFQTASLYKLFIMAKTYDDLESGTLGKSRVLADTVQRLNQRFDIDPEYAEMTEGSFSMTIEEALEKMITISHNYAALLLSADLKISRVQDLIDRYELTHTRLGTPPISTPEDMARFYELLYEGKMVSQDASKEMIALLARQQLNDRIPALLPEGIKIAHKTGELGSFKHDAGIVFTNVGDYILVLMSETPSQENAITVEAKISEEVYKYVTGQKS